MKKKIQVILGIIIGIVLMWFLLRHTKWDEVFTALNTMHWGWMTLSIVGVFASFFTRVKRWSYIVRTAKPVSYRHMFSATQVGFLCNFIFPGRAGEVVRALALSRLAQLPFTKSFAFVALDRLTDLFGLIAVMLIAMVGFKPTEAITIPEEFIDVPDWAQGLLQPDVIQKGAMGFGFFLIVLVIAFVILYLNQRLVLRISDAILGLVSKKLADTIHNMIVHFSEGLHVFRSIGDMAKAIGWSFVTWGIACLSYAAVIRAFDVNEPWYASFIVLAMLSVAIAAPGAPGFVGQFHFGILLGLYLVVPDINYNVAMAIAIMSHLINLIPVILVGVYCLSTEHFGLGELRRESAHIQEETGEES